MAEKKTSEAQRKAINKYEKRHDTISIHFEEGTIEFLRSHGVDSINAYVKKLVEADMLKKKEESEDPSEQ